MNRNKKYEQFLKQTVLETTKMIILQSVDIKSPDGVESEQTLHFLYRAFDK